MKQTLLALALVLILGSCKTEKKESITEKINQDGTMETKIKLSNKQKTLAVLKSIETGD